MKRWFWMLPTLALGLMACGPTADESSAPNTNSAVGENPLSAPADYLGAAAKAKRSATRTVDLAAVTRAVQMFQATEGRNPATLDELVTQGYLPSLPALPAGQQYQYNPQTGQLRIVTQ
jgi:hypothetical protein